VIVVETGSPIVRLGGKFGVVMADITRAATPLTSPTFRELLAVFGRIGILSFGGPAGQIAMMHKVLVDEHAWIDEKRYLSALNFCMVLPGPEAMQLATYVGWRLHGVRGGLAAGLLFVLPGALVMLVLSLVYAALGHVPVVAAVFLGIKAAVLAIVVEALLRISRRALKGSGDWWTAALAFVAIFVFDVPFPLIILTAGLIGYWRGRFLALPAANLATGTAVSHAKTARTIAVWLAIWLVPLVALVALLGPAHVLSQLAWFYSKLAVVTFGGAYAVLAYMAQDVVQHYGWLTAGEMVDGLGLAETTPGPLILVTQFVGTLAAYRASGGASPMLWGLAGAVVTLWATFAPCFLWVFAGAPYVEALNHAPRLSAALRAVTACVVGVILNLTVWFALHVLFRTVTTQHLGALKLTLPDVSTAQPLAFGLAALACVLLFGYHRSIAMTLAICAGLAVVASQLVSL
jgi:chromate transporter